MSSSVRGAISNDTLAQRIDELRPFASAARLATAGMVGLLLLSWGRSQAWVFGVVGLWGAAAAINIWRVSSGRSDSDVSLRYFVLTLLVLALVVRGTEDATLLIVLMVQPIMMCTLLRGMRTGLLVSGVGATGLIAGWNGGPAIEPQYLLPALGLLVLPPLMAVVARPMASLRQRMRLAEGLERDMDPRRGLLAVGGETLQRLLSTTSAQRVILCHRDAEWPTLLMGDHDEGIYQVSDALANRILSLLTALPTRPVAIDAHGHPLTPTQRHDVSVDDPDLRQRCQDLASLLEAEYLQIVPNAPGSATTGWLLVAYGTDDTPAPAWWRRPHWRQQPWPLPTLAAFAAENRQLLQQASYVDSLQAEIAAHERSRIGRDLHDSAIQPYLGLKFALEGLALHCTPDNPLHHRFQELRAVCDAELIELRKTVSALRSGRHGGENSLAAALQRQCGRFARLFGIEIDLQVPAELAATPTQISSLLHMVNEALNNIRRHTQARRVWIRVTGAEGQLQLIVRDDAGQRAGVAAPDFEPRSLSERARDLGGTLQMRRHDGIDTEILITLPL